MKRTVVAFLLAPLWVPAAEVAYTAYKIPFLKPRYLVIGAIISAIFAYGGALIFGLPAFHALGFFGVRNRKSFWIATVLGFGIGVLTALCFLVFCFSLFAPDFNIAFVLNQWNWSAFWWEYLPMGVLGSIVGGTLWLIARPDRRRA
jgi:ABC-type transport system involved in multi-copper enzyme maturation permease subunit